MATTTLDDGSEPRVRYSNNAIRENEHVTLYCNLGHWSAIVAVVGTSQPERLERMAGDLMDAAATLRARQQAEADERAIAAERDDARHRKGGKR